MLANVYVDGFNLYYGRLKGTPHKWLDLEKLLDKLLPNFEVQKIRYFTARVSSSPHNPDVALRQQVYLRALYTQPRVSVHFGHFLVTKARMALSNPPRHGSQTVEVIKTEEKGSDVALGALLVHHGYQQRYEAAIVVSNDSDLVLPIKIVRHELGLPVGILNPHRTYAVELVRAASFKKQVRTGVLAAAQLPDTLEDEIGTITKPDRW